MAENQTLSLDDFKTRILDRFRQPATVLAENDLVRILDEGVFKEFVIMKEYCEQVRLIAAKIFEATPPGNQDLQDYLSMMNSEIDKMFQVYQESLLNLPQATTCAEAAE
jgi:hypothetical protein